LSESTRTWWAGSTVRARWTAAAASFVALCLIAVSVVVWTSPQSPLPQAVESLVSGSSELEELTEERRVLLAELRELQSELEKKDGDLTVATAEQERLQNALWSAEGQLQAMQAASADRQAAAAAASAKKPSSSGKPSGSTGKPSTQPAAPITAPSKAELLAPTTDYFGMYTVQAPWSWATFDDTSNKIGVQPSAVGYFGGWDENFRPEGVTRAWKEGRLPLLTWEARPIASQNDVVEEPEYSLPRILDGAFDEYLRQYARDIVATGLPLGIRLNHEMNSIWYPWNEVTGKGEPINGNRPGDYVKVWQHVHQIFEQEGANDQVIWIWAPNRIDRLPSALRDPSHLAGLYPGDEYVDWVGMSGYLRPPYDDPKMKFNFEETFGATLTQLRALTDKPIFLAEIGASETAGHKPKWVKSFFEALARPENDDIVGFAWFNLAVTSYVQGERATNDWRIDSRADSLAAFIEGITGEGSDFIAH
jgi:mannan endo-1,4-beta-mannosidase